MSIRPCVHCGGVATVVESNGDVRYCKRCLRNQPMKKKAKSHKPQCVFCGKSEGVQFAIFNPKFPPMGTACVECEKLHDKLPPDAPSYNRPHDGRTTVPGAAYTLPPGYKGV